MTQKHILLATEHDADREDFESAFAKTCPGIRLSTVTSASELLERLQVQGIHEVSFVLVDLDLPGMRESAMLQRLSEDTRFRSLPVVVMSDTDTAAHVIETYQLGASAFVGKPKDETARLLATRAMGDFWLDINVTPKPEVSLF